MFMMHSPGSDVLPLQTVEHTEEGLCLAKEICRKQTPCHDPSGECYVVDPDCHKEQLAFLDPISERCPSLKQGSEEKTGIFLENKIQ